MMATFARKEFALGSLTAGPRMSRFSRRGLCLCKDDPVDVYMSGINEYRYRVTARCVVICDQILYSQTRLRDDC